MRVVALVTDLMDRSKITSVDPDIEFALEAHRASGADVVIVDLRAHAEALRAIRQAAPDAWIVAYGQHVDTDALRAAVEDGANRAVPRSQFFRDISAMLHPAR